MSLRRIVNTVCLSLAACVAGATFYIKHDVERLSDRVIAVKAEIAEERDTLGVLNAEWAHLNRPERLRDLARRYLSMDPATAEQIVPARDAVRSLNQIDAEPETE